MKSIWKLFAALPAFALCVALSGCENTSSEAQPPADTNPPKTNPSAGSVDKNTNPTDKVPAETPTSTTPSTEKGSEPALEPPATKPGDADQTPKPAAPSGGDADKDKADGDTTK